MERTISMMVGKGSLNHNNRTFIAKNVDSERSKGNKVYVKENIKKVYHTLFDEALEAYNAKQTRADRRIDNYYEKVRTSKQEKLFHELIVQIGNRDDTNCNMLESVYAQSALEEYMMGFQERNPNLRVFNAVMHLDEETPHLHIDYVPFSTGNKRGLETKVSLKGALKAQGFIGTGRFHTEWKRWVESEKQCLAEIKEHFQMKWLQKGTHEKHLSVYDYEKKMRKAEVEELEQEISGQKDKIADQSFMMEVNEVALQSQGQIFSYPHTMNDTVHTALLYFLPDFYNVHRNPVPCPCLSVLSPNLLWLSLSPAGFSLPFPHSPSKSALEIAMPPH